MRRTVSASIYLILALLVTTTVWAQPMRMTPEERTDRIAKQLELADSTKAKVLEIFKSSDAARSKAFEAAGGDRDQMRSSMESIRNDTDAKLKAVLTADQYDKYIKARAEMMKGRGPGGGQ
jgi:periplasmic protein CpxP/Spy